MALRGLRNRCPACPAPFRSSEGDLASRREVMHWIWPAGARGLLAAAVIAAALGLAVASHSVPEPGAEIVKAPDLLLDLNTVPARVLETLAARRPDRWCDSSSRPENYGLSHRWMMPAAGSEVWGRSPWPRSLLTCDLIPPRNRVSTIPRVQLDDRPAAKPRSTRTGRPRGHGNRNRRRSSRDLFRGRRSPRHFEPETGTRSVIGAESLSGMNGFMPRTAG